MSETQVNQNQNQDGKNAAKFTKLWKKAEGLFGSAAPEKADKISAVSANTIAQEVLREREERVLLAFKEDLHKVLDKKLEIDREIKKAENELKQLKDKKLGELNQQMETAFQKVEEVRATTAETTSELEGSSEE